MAYPQTRQQGWAARPNLGPKMALSPWQRPGAKERFGMGPGMMGQAAGGWQQYLDAGQGDLTQGQYGIPSLSMPGGGLPNMDGGDTTPDYLRQPGFDPQSSILGRTGPPQMNPHNTPQMESALASNVAQGQQGFQQAQANSQGRIQAAGIQGNPYSTPRGLGQDAQLMVDDQQRQMTNPLGNMPGTTSNNFAHNQERLAMNTAPNSPGRPMYPELQDRPQVDPQRRADVQAAMHETAQANLVNKYGGGEPGPRTEYQSPYGGVMNDKGPNVLGANGFRSPLADATGADSPFPTGVKYTSPADAHMRQTLAEKAGYDNRARIRDVQRQNAFTQANSPSGLQGQAAQADFARRQQGFEHWGWAHQNTQGGVPYQPDHGPGYHPYGPAAATAQGNAQLQGQAMHAAPGMQHGQNELLAVLQQAGVPAEQLMQMGGQQQYPFGGQPGMLPIQQQRPQGQQGFQSPLGMNRPDPTSSHVETALDYLRNNNINDPQMQRKYLNSQGISDQHIADYDKSKQGYFTDNKNWGQEDPLVTQRKRLIRGLLPQQGGQPQQAAPMQGGQAPMQQQAPAPGPQGGQPPTNPMNPFAFNGLGFQTDPAAWLWKRLNSGTRPSTPGLGGFGFGPGGR